MTSRHRRGGSNETGMKHFDHTVGGAGKVELYYNNGQTTAVKATVTRAPLRNAKGSAVAG
jgi:hypothetical protein